MQELKALLEKQNSDWEEFKKTNDIRIKSLEDRKTVDPLIDEKLAKLNADLSKTSEQLTGIEAKMNRPGFGGGKTDERQEVAEHKAAFGGFLRPGPYRRGGRGPAGDSDLLPSVERGGPPGRTPGLLGAGGKD